MAEGVSPHPQGTHYTQIPTPTKVAGRGILTGNWAGKSKWKKGGLCVPNTLFRQRQGVRLSVFQTLGKSHRFLHEGLDLILLAVVCERVGLLQLPQGICVLTPLALFGPAPIGLAVDGRGGELGVTGRVVAQKVCQLTALRGWRELAGGRGARTLGGSRALWRLQILWGPVDLLLGGGGWTLGGRCVGC